MFEYTTEMIRLAVELCKGSLGLVFNEFSTLFPLNACISILLSSELDSKIKNVFLKLIRECYLVYDFRLIAKQKYPNYVKLLPETKGTIRPALEAEEEHMVAIRSRYFKQYLEEENSLMTEENLNLKGKTFFSFKISIKY